MPLFDTFEEVQYCVRENIFQKGKGCHESYYCS